MQILRIQPKIDNRKRYNYKVNYGVWDCIDTETIFLEDILTTQDSFIESFDLVFLPMYKRWEYYLAQLERIKKLNVKTVLFDNDSCYRSFSDSFYNGIYFIFYRIKDKDSKNPKTPSAKLHWSVDTEYYTPNYGGKGISFNCTVNHHSYELRKEIARHIKPTSYFGNQYVEHLQNSAAGIHTNSKTSPIPRCKMLEYAACGTEIISNRMEGMNDYFPDELITYFDTIDELLEIVDNFKPSIEVQKELRKIVEDTHSDKQRSLEVMDTLKKHFKLN